MEERIMLSINHGNRQPLTVGVTRKNRFWLIYVRLSNMRKPRIGSMIHELSHNEILKSLRSLAVQQTYSTPTPIDNESIQYSHCWHHTTHKFYHQRYISHTIGYLTKLQLTNKWQTHLLNPLDLLLAFHIFSAGSNKALPWYSGKPKEDMDIFPYKLRIFSNIPWSITSIATSLQFSKTQSSSKTWSHCSACV